MTTPPRIILPDSGDNLLRRELAAAFAALGCDVLRASPGQAADPARLAGLLEDGPALLLSVNFQALERPRPVLETLARRNSRAAVWCVDNPWNILAGVRDPSWKSLPFFVVDKSFVEPLRRAGAERVFHLPLAACPELFAAPGLPLPESPAPLAFVGRLAFPGKEDFFAGIRVPEEVIKQANDLLDAGSRPDFDWWTARLGADPARFWPGKTARGPALGAETCNLRLRGESLRAAASAGARLAASGAGLDIYGDAPGEPLPAARVHPPVDYYGRLPGVYRAARYSLCCTSLLLPHGLNQRHFDIWTAGGVCLTDNTPGLDLFPADLTRASTWARPSDIPAVLESLEKMPASGRAGLIRDWQTLLAREHTYARRAAEILERCA